SLARSRRTRSTNRRTWTPGRRGTVGRSRERGGAPPRALDIGTGEGDVGLALLLSAGLVLLVDRLTKEVVARRLAEGQSVRVAPGVGIRHVTNRGGGPTSPRQRAALLLAWGSALGGILLVTQLGDLFRHPAAQVGLGAALGGAAGNLYDRLRRGAVIDFFDVA